MRVLHIDTERSWGGGQNQVRLLVEGMVEQGFETFLACPAQSELMRRAPKGCHSFGTTAGAGFLNAFKLASFIRKNGIDVVDAHTGKAHSLGFLLKWLNPKLRLVVHRRIATAPKINWVTRLKYLSKSVDHFVAISQSVRSTLLDYGVSSHRIDVISSAVDERPYLAIDRTQCGVSLRKALGVGPQTLLIGATGRLSREKGHEVLLNAIALVKPSYSEFHCVIVGSGPEYDSLQNLIVSLKLSPFVSLLGFRDDIASLMAGLDIFVHPSLQEGLGTILLEASLCGCAILASRTGGIPEVIEDQVNGLLVPPDDPNALAEALLHLIQHPERRRGLASAGSQRAAEKFQRQTMIDANIGVYRRLLKANLSADKR